MDDFDYGDDQDDAQRIEEKRRQLEEEAIRLNAARLDVMLLSLFLLLLSNRYY